MRNNYKRIGDFIELVDERNNDLNVNVLLGLTIDKKFIPSVANIIGTNMKRYKIIRKNQFACSLMQVRRDKKMPIALLKDYEEAIISQAYPVFRVIDESILLPDYLMLWFSRTEFDREATFHAVGGVRGSVEWEDFLNFELPVPSIEKQRAIVAEYQSVENKIKTNEQICEKLEATAQALYKHWFVDFEFPINLSQDNAYSITSNQSNTVKNTNLSTTDNSPNSQSSIINSPNSQSSIINSQHSQSNTINSPPPEGCPQDGEVKNTPETQRTYQRIPRDTKAFFSLPYNPKLKERARALRKAGNLAEVLFWKEVRNRQFLGLDFDRQKIIGNYIVDFYNANLGVVIEIDGSSHDHKQEYDAQRDAYLESLGLTVIHITDEQVKKNIAGVMIYLEDHEVFKSDIIQEVKSTDSIKEHRDKDETESQGTDGSATLPVLRTPLHGRGTAGYKSSGGKMVYNEELDKEIPEGWEVGTIGDMFTLQRGHDLPSRKRIKGKYPIFASTGIADFHNEFKFDKPTVITGRSGSIGELFYYDKPCWPLNTTLYIKEFLKSRPFHSFYVLDNLQLKKRQTGSAVPTLNRNHIHSLIKEIPPINVVVNFEFSLNKIQVIKENFGAQNIKLSQLQDLLLSRMASEN